MKIHRFIYHFDTSQTVITITDTEIVHQIRDVLRLKIGECVIVMDGRGNEAQGIIKQIDKNTIKLDLEKVKKNSNELDIIIRLFCSVLKRENFELVVQKATELGVKEIVPLNCERTIKTNFNHVRFGKIIKEAAEQSERGIIPTLLPTEDFKKSILQPRPGSKVLFDKSGDDMRSLILNRPSKDISPLELYIGPEGGWTENELNLAIQNHIKIMNLGKTTLRAETAALTALCLVRLLDTTH